MVSQPLKPTLALGVIEEVPKAEANVTSPSQRGENVDMSKENDKDKIDPE